MVALDFLPVFRHLYWLIHLGHTTLSVLIYLDYLYKPRSQDKDKPICQFVKDRGSESVYILLNVSE